MIFGLERKSNMKDCKIEELYNLEETIAKQIFENLTYPWEVLPKIGEFILELGNTLSKEEYEKVGENIWIAKSAKVAETALIKERQVHWQWSKRCSHYCRLHCRTGRGSQRRQRLHPLRRFQSRKRGYRRYPV